MEEQVDKGGRPPFYETPEDLQDKVDYYFESGHKYKTVIIGKAPNQESIELPIITVTGLAIYLGFESRQSFYDYEKKSEFTYIIKRARLFIEENYEEQLQYGNTTGAIFALKNMGWKDKQELDIQDKRPKIIMQDISGKKMLNEDDDSL